MQSNDRGILANKEEQSSLSSKEDSCSEQQAAFSQESAKILVIDDEALVRESFSAYLEDSGYFVIEACDGQSGIELFTRENPDLVLCDLRMPGVDGLEVLRAIERQNPELPVIVVSGAGVMNDVVAALRLGAADYLIKPMTDMAVLQHSVEKSLERARLFKQNQLYRSQLEKANQKLSINLEELRKDQYAGRQVQLNLLPNKQASFLGFEFFQRILPSLYLSGDFVDFFPINDVHGIFYIADVAGHGASSAFVTVVLKNLCNQLRREFHLELNEDILHPAKILERVNKELLQVKLGKHLTMFVAVIERGCKVLRYSIGAHLPSPVLIGHEQKSQPYFLPGKGMPLGLFDHVEYKEHEIVFEQGMQLALFSDGVLEILPQASLAEKESYLLSILSHATSIEALEQTFALDQVKATPDDIALMLVSRIEY